MARIHITLVGGQTMPVYIGILENPVDQIVLIHSNDSLKEAKQIKKTLDSDPKTLSSNLEMRLFDPVDYNKILLGVQQCYKDYAKQDNEISINISSGTKPWAIAFYSVFGNKEDVIIEYIDQNCVIYDYTHHTSNLSKLNFDIPSILKYNGKQVDSSHSSFDEYTEDDLKNLKVIQDIRKVYFDDFNGLTISNKKVNPFSEGQNIGKYSLKNGSTISWNKDSHFVQLDIKGKNGELVKRRIASLHALHLVFYAGWFEYKVAILLSKWKYAKEIWLNVTFPYANKNPKNEIDVIVNTGVKLLFVECKTHIFNQTDIDKFRTVVKNYGGMGCKALFITEEKMRNDAKEKCSDSSILALSLKEEPSPQSLYSLLENHLFSINSK